MVFDFSCFGLPLQGVWLPGFESAGVASGTFSLPLCGPPGTVTIVNSEVDIRLDEGKIPLNMAGFVSYVSKSSWRGCDVARFVFFRRVHHVHLFFAIWVVATTPP